MSKVIRKTAAILFALAIMTIGFPLKAAYATGVNELSDSEKNSSYGFFVWLSENAENEADRKDAAIAAEIISNGVSTENYAKVFNQGNIIGGSHSISYNDLLSATSIGAENDATSVEDIREAIAYIVSGNDYRAKESLAPLAVSSALMAMAELNANYQDINAVFDHSNVFSAMENLAYAQIEGTWKYGSFPGASDDPYEGWYTEEKANFDANNGKATGHYKTLTDRQGVMLLTGFGVRHRYVTETLVASDKNQYECLMHDKYYSQMFSTKSDMYDVADGITPDRYLEYLDLYQCTVIGHPWNTEYTVDKEPTCSETGSKSIHCSICDAIDETSVTAIDKVDHKYSDWIVTKAATCTDPGEKERNCTECGTVFTEVVQAEGHKFGEWEIEKEPTFDAEGSKERICSVCGEKETETIEKLPEPANAQDDPSPDNPGGDPSGNPQDDPSPDNPGGDPSGNPQDGSSPDNPGGDPSGNPQDGSSPDNPGGNPSGNTQDDPAGDPSDGTPADRAEQKAADGTAVGKGASAEAAEAAIAGMTSDNDLPGAVFNKLQLKSSKQTKTSITLSWKKVSGAKTYVIYGNKCGKANTMKRLAKSTGKSRKFTKVLGKKVKKGTYYKFMIVALDADNNIVSSSKIIHVATKGGKVGNVGKITVSKKVKKNKLSVKKGRSFKLGAKQVAASKKLKVRKHRALKYESSNKKIATVSSKGVVKGKKKGTCYVYAYAQNGVFKKIKVTVK